MKFVARTTCPTKGNKFYTRKDSGGYSGACKGKPAQDCDALSNCAGYSYGRIAEASGRKSCDLCEPTSPGVFDKYLYNGCTKGATPKLGAIIVWTKDGGKEIEGHVGNVEAIIDNDTIVCSESHYGGSAWDLNIHGTTDGKKYYKSGYTFKCFIYSPYIETPDDEIDGLKGQLIDYQIDYDAKCKELATITAELEQANKDKANLTTELETAQNSLKTANTELTQTSKELATAKTKAEMLEASYNKLNTEKADLLSQIDLYKNSCGTYGEKLEEQQAEIKELKEKVESLEFNINEYLGELNDNKVTIDDLSHKLSEANRKLELSEANKNDINGDGAVDLADVFALLKIIFKK